MVITHQFLGLTKKLMRRERSAGRNDQDISMPVVDG